MYDKVDEMFKERNPAFATLNLSMRQWRSWQGGKGGERPPWQGKCKNWGSSSWHFDI